MDDYRAKRALFEAESTFVVDAGALVRSVGGGALQQIALGDVRKVALICQPSLSDRWVCVVEGGGVRISFPSASFTGPGRTEDRRTAFRAS